MNEGQTRTAAVFDFLDRLDRRIIYLLIALSLAIPLTLKHTLQPAEMHAATAFFAELEKLRAESGKIVLLAAEWGPGTLAENQPQTAVTIEHLMRRRIPFALVSTYNLSAPFLDSLPREIVAQLEKESPGEQWVYGKDWVNLGYRPGQSLFVQNLARSDDWHNELKTDATGTPLEDIPCMKDVKSVNNVSIFIEFTGLVGVFSDWVQFFRSENYRPPFLHGCTSITIPEAHTYLSAKQILGLHEGIVGAAWHDELLSKNYPNRAVGSAQVMNTSVAFAQILIIFLIILGNAGSLYRHLQLRGGHSD